MFSQHPQVPQPPLPHEPQPGAGRIRTGAMVGAAAVLDAIAVGQLVAETALQAAALARQLRRIQAQVLLLRHLDRDGLERTEPGRAAERPPTRAVAAEHLGFVPHPDLTHLDSGLEVRRQIAHELAEIDPRVGRVIEDDPRAVEELLHFGQLHRQAALANLQLRTRCACCSSCWCFRRCTTSSRVARRITTWGESGAADGVRHGPNSSA